MSRWKTVPFRNIAFRLGVVLGTAGFLVCPQFALAARPCQPLPAPLYSFDVNSPSVLDITDQVTASALLILVDPDATIDIPGNQIGLNDPADDIDALATNSLIQTGTSFVILFSVSRSTTGGAVVNAALGAANVPYNVADQAGKGQAAGDQYMSLKLFTSAGPNGQRGTLDNNTLSRNQYNEGGTGFGADPPIGAAATNFVAVPEDNVNAMFDPGAPTGPLGVFISASELSPSLGLFPGVNLPGGADIIFEPDVRDGVATPNLFATATDLGLTNVDDIDGLVVIDDGVPGVFDASDIVLFSLTPTSPSLGTIVGANAVNPAADVFIARSGTQPTLFASAASLGLQNAGDDIDALDISLCTDALACAGLSGIRDQACPVPAVSEWGVAVIALLVLVFGSILIRERNVSVLSV